MISANEIIGQISNKDVNKPMDPLSLARSYSKIADMSFDFGQT